MIGEARECLSGMSGPHLSSRGRPQAEYESGRGYRSFALHLFRRQRVDLGSFRAAYLKAAALPVLARNTRGRVVRS